MSTALPVMSCDGCGVCCMHMAVPPYHRDEITLLPPEVQADYEAARNARIAQWNAHKIDETACAWFDMVTRKCRHYEHRPEICQDFEMGGDECVAYRLDAEPKELK